MTGPVWGTTPRSPKAGSADPRFAAVGRTGPSRSPLAFLPTPLHPLDRLVEELALGGDAPRVWMKRDDMTGLAAGGNKARKLEYLVADALAQGADTLITAGAVQSNHARQTAAAARAAGLEADLVLVEESDDPDYQRSGNVLLDDLLGARSHRIDAALTPPDEAMESIAAELRARGRTPYVVPIGGSSPLGAYGYALCATEILADVHADLVVHASGSGGTQAGLLAGFTAVENPPEVLGFSVGFPAGELAARVHELANETVPLVAGARPVEPDEVRVDDGFVGDGYGVPTKEMAEAVSLLARTEGILLDPVYTGKAMAGLIAGLREGRFAGRSDVVFLHTGGLPGLFAYRAFFQEVP